MAKAIKKPLSEVFKVLCPLCGKQMTVTWTQGWQCKECNPLAFEKEKNFVVGRDNYTGD